MTTYLKGIGCGLLLSFFSPLAGLADDNEADYSSVSVRAAHVVEVADTGAWRLKATFTNESQSNMVLLGFHVTGAQHSLPFKVKVGEGEYRDLEAFTLAPEEALDLTSSHIVAEFDHRLKSQFSDDRLEAVLHTTQGYIPFLAHTVIR